MPQRRTVTRFAPRKPPTPPTLRPFQRDGVDFLAANNWRVLLADAPGCGKAQPLDAPVLTPSGWKPIGMLSVGDVVVDPDGGIAQVRGVYPQGTKSIYRVTFTDGSSAECCDDHLWLTRDRAYRTRTNNGWSVRSLREMREAGVHEPRNGSPRFSVPLAEPVVYGPLEAPLLLDPYLLGALLGDGHLAASVRFATADSDLLDVVRVRLPQGVSVKHKKGYDYSLVGGAIPGVPNPLLRALAALGLKGKRSHEKHIPSVYLHAGIDDRLALLRGLMDTDGTAGAGHPTFTTISAQLADDVCELARSLGASVTRFTPRHPPYTYLGERRVGRAAYTLRIRMGVNPFTLARKAEKFRPAPRLKSIERIEFARKSEAVCIAVDSQRHLYITSDFTVTHNTPQVLVAMRENAAKLCPALVICPSSVALNWAREARRWLPGAKVQVIEGMSSPILPGHHLTVCGWDIIAPRVADLLVRRFKLIVADEAHYAKAGDATQRGRALQTLAGTSPHLLLLSGTPLVNDADELDTLRAMFGETPPPMLRRLLEDVAPDIPPKKRITLRTAIPDVIRTEYDQARAEFGEWLDDYLAQALGDPGAAASAASRALAAESLSKVAYLRRILGRGKVPGAAAWIASMRRKGEPVVVFGMFSDVVDVLGQILARMEIPFVRLDGTASRGQRQQAIDAFQRGDIDVFLGTQAAKEGITLVRARHLLFLERWYTPAAEEQAEDRIRRIGQTRATTIWYLHADDSIDDRITQIVEAKRGIVAANIGTANIEHIEYDGVLDAWQRMRVLSDGVPTVASNPTASIPLPRLPNPKIVHAVIFDGTQWPIPDVQKALRQAGYRLRGLRRKDKLVRIEVRSAGSFVAGSIRAVKLGEGFGVQAGRPAGSDAQRAASYRKLKKPLLLRAVKRRRG